ncbi:hypothetical protein D3C78_1549560 [compost metagenome]
MLANQPITNDKACLDIVDHNTAGLAEQVGSHPVRAATVLICTYAVECQGEVLGAGGEHPPHIACVLAA